MSHLTLPDPGPTDTVTVVDMAPVVDMGPVVTVVLCQLTTTTEVRTVADLCRNTMQPRYQLVSLLLTNTFHSHINC